MAKVSHSTSPGGADGSAAFVIGSGRSLLDLTAEEKRFLAAQPHTLAMNQYLMYWEKVGVLPRDLFMVDKAGAETDVILAEVLRRARRLVPAARFYVHRNYVWQYFGATLRNKVGGIKRRLSLWLRHRCWLPFRGVELVGVRTVYFKDPEARPFPWARSLDQPLCHFRGSLTAAINLASVVYPVSRIKLVGVDLNTYLAFYGKSFDRYLRRYRLRSPDAPYDGFHAEAQLRDVHQTAIESAGRPSILSVLPTIRRRLEREGIELVCCNRESLLVTAGACPYEGILPRD